MAEPPDLRTQLAQAFSKTATANGRRLGPLRFDLADAALAVFDDQAAQRVAEEMWQRVRLRELAFRDGTATMELTDAQEIAAGFAAAARTLLDGSENYTEITFTAKAAESPQTYVFTVRRSEGLTPHQLRERAEAERGAALAKVAAVRDLARSWAHLAPADDWGDSMGDTAAADAGRAVLAALGESGDG